MLGCVVPELDDDLHFPGGIALVAIGVVALQEVVEGHSVAEDVVVFDTPGDELAVDGEVGITGLKQREDGANVSRNAGAAVDPTPDFHRFDTADTCQGFLVEGEVVECRDE